MLEHLTYVREDFCKYRTHSKTISRQPLIQSERVLRDYTRDPHFWGDDIVQMVQV